MQDRFSEFQAGVKPFDASTPLKSYHPSDIELGFIKRKKEVFATEPPNSPHQTDFDTFNREIEAVRASLATFRANIDLVQGLYIKSIGSISNEKADKASAELDTLLHSTNDVAKRIKLELDNMRKSTEALHSSPTHLPPADFKIRVNQHSALTQKFQDLVREYQELQSNYKTKFEEKVRRQYLIAYPDASEDDIQKAVAYEESGDVFAQQLQNQPQAAQDALEYISHRHADIVHLEKSIRELAQLFTDMSVLVDSQGELINQIEYNVTASEVYIEEGNRELESAVRSKRRHRKLAVILTLLILILAAIIVVPIVLTLT